MSHKVLKVTPIQYDILIAITELISKREDEPHNNKKTSINAHSISQMCGRSYNAIKKNLKLLKEI